MSKSPIKTVVKFEVFRQLKKPSFWIALLMLPLLILGLFGLSALSNSKTEEVLLRSDIAKDKIVGIIDQSNVIAPELLYSEDLAENIGSAKEIKIMVDKEEGIHELKENHIDLLYVIPDNFAEEKKVESYTHDSEASLLSSSDAPIRSILAQSAALKTTPENSVILSNSYQTINTTFDKDGNTVNLLGRAVVPLAILGVFYILICVFGNRLLMAVVEEKENRISEMILTAISSKHLIIGKIIALVLLGFLQIAVLIIPVIAAVILNKDNPAVSYILGIIEWDPITILMNVVLLIISYFLFAGACTMVGTLVPTARDASNFIAPVMIGVIAPIMFVQNFIGATPDVITYVLSYFPLSAPIAMMLRNAFGTLPTWEFILGLVEITIFTYFIVRATVKSFQKNAINFSIVKLNFGKKNWNKN